MNEGNQMNDVTTKNDRRVKLGIGEFKYTDWNSGKTGKTKIINFFANKRKNKCIIDELYIKSDKDNNKAKPNFRANQLSYNFFGKIHNHARTNFQVYEFGEDSKEEYLTWNKQKQLKLKFNGSERWLPEKFVKSFRKEENNNESD